MRDVMGEQELSVIREIGELTNDACAIFDMKDFRTAYMNEKAMALLPPLQSNSKSPLDILVDLSVEEDKAFVRNTFVHLQKTQTTAELEFRIRPGPESVRTICCKIYLVSDARFMILLMEDATERKQYENYLVEFGTRKNQLLDTLLHNISGALNLMQSLSNQATKSLHSENAENLKTYIGLLSENSRHCIDMINDLWSEEHLQSADVPIKTSRVDIVELTRLIYHNISQSYTFKKFQLNCPYTSLQINTDDVKLMQVINNLISNAIKYTDNAGRIIINVQDTKNAVIISISDNGIGIPDDLKPFVFDRKGVAGRTGLNGEKSVGLGLSICKRLATMMGGKIWFESDEGKGSTFYISLPAG